MTYENAAILVVDDNEDNRDLLVRRLSKEGYTNLTFAEDGQIALQRLVEQPFDLVLLDIMMPNLNGYEVLAEMKSDPGLRDIPVLMVSAVQEGGGVVQCIELGAEDYLNKPFDPAILRARVSACLEKGRLRAQEAHYINSIEIEKQRSDALLHAILPHGAIRELKASNEVKPRRYDDIAILFCDIVGFTSYCDSHPPEQVVAELQSIMVGFEEVIEANSMEKIKTIGDAVFATAGLLRHVDDPVFSAAKCGLEMIEASRSLDPGWEVRVGVHCGSAVAGIIGRGQFLFDLWGDAVNIAARITDQACPSSLLMSGEAWLHVRNKFRGKSMGFVELKGKGELELIQCLGLPFTGDTQSLGQNMAGAHA